MTITKSDRIKEIRSNLLLSDGSSVQSRSSEIVVNGSNIGFSLDITGIELAEAESVRDQTIKKIQETTDFEKINIVLTSTRKSQNTSTEKPKIQIEGVGQILLIASGKGGVGKSTIAALLAHKLKSDGKKVGIVDADIYGPSMPTMFDVVGERPSMLDVDGKPLINPVMSYGIKILSIGFFTEQDNAVVWRGPMAAKALTQMVTDAYWGELDFLLIDLPPGTGDIHLSLVQTVPLDGVVIVSTPQEVALADARKGINMFKMEGINVPIVGVVENMAWFTPAELPENKYYLFGRDGAKNLAEGMNVPFLGHIPLVQSVREAGDVGKPAVFQENTPTSNAFQELAKTFVDELKIAKIKNSTKTQENVVQ